MVGIEPTTDGLRNRCSTTELHWRKWFINKRLSSFSKEHTLWQVTDKCQCLQPQPHLESETKVSQNTWRGNKKSVELKWHPVAIRKSLFK